MSLVRVGPADSGDGEVAGEFYESLLCSILVEVLDGIIDGDLPERYLPERYRKSKALLDKYKAERMAVDEPRCYIIYIVDDNGKPPTLADYREITALMDTYINKKT